jgi:hypothetical protein
VDLNQMAVEMPREWWRYPLAVKMPLDVEVFRTALADVDLNQMAVEMPGGL